MKLYHCTDSSDLILKSGFRNTTGYYMMTERITGVFFSNWPLDCNEGAKGDVVLSIDIPEDKIIKYEIIEEDKPYREFCIPAALANKYRPPIILTDAEVDDLYIVRFSSFQ